jgi:uncharacterized membrane protein YjjP (DUF1212 family)
VRSIAAAYGYPRARVAVFPTVLIVAVREGESAGLRTIDSAGELRLDQASDVIGLARTAEHTRMSPARALAELERILARRPRFGAAASIVSHGVLTVGLGLVINPAPVDLSIYAVLGIVVGAMKAWASRYGTGGYLLPVVAAALISAIAFLAHGGNDAASLRLTIPPLVTFLPGALLTMATVDLAMGETVTGASRFVAGLLQLALLAIGIVVGAELVGTPHAGPVAGAAADTLGSWSPWAGVAVFGLGVYIHNSAPKRSLPWLLVVLFTGVGRAAGREGDDRRDAQRLHRGRRDGPRGPPGRPRAHGATRPRHVPTLVLAARARHHRADRHHRAGGRQPGGRVAEPRHSAGRHPGVASASLSGR